MFDYLFKEGKIGKLNLKNRGIVPAMLTGYANEDGSINERFIRYYEEKAKGGFALIIVEDTAVESRGRGFKNLPGLWSEDLSEKHKELTRRVKAHGSKIFVQLYHAGREGSKYVNGGEEIVSPSGIQDPTSKELPHKLSTNEIYDLINKYIYSATLAKNVGYDGVELHGAHGYLINQFLSPYSNKRTDEFGGSFLNRLKFPLDIIRGIKEKCGKDFIISYRISADEMVEGGLTIEDTKIIVPILEKNEIDVIHVSASVYKTGYMASAPMTSKSLPFIKYAEEIKKVVSKIPVIGVNKINNPFYADGILRENRCDFVSLGRASIADPYIMEKSKKGLLNEINYCIGCWQGCQGNLPKQKPVTCLVNPLVGLEDDLCVKEADCKKKVMVIGAGVAGMYASYILAKRGHEVYLYEKESELGGQFLLSAIPPGKEIFNNFIIYLKTMIEKYKVNVILHTLVDEKIIDNIKPDYVILSTGANEINLRVKGSDYSHVVLASSVLKGKEIIKENAVIVGGGLVGAEVLAHVIEHSLTGATLIEMGSKFANGMVMAPKVLLKKHLKEGGGKILLNTKLLEIEKDRIKIEREGKEEFLKADQVIVCIGSRSNNNLKEILDGKYSYSLIGDAKEVSNAVKAVRDAHEIAIKI